jgi:hypothetical protein
MNSVNNQYQYQSNFSQGLPGNNVQNLGSKYYEFLKNQGKSQLYQSFEGNYAFPNQQSL